MHIVIVFKWKKMEIGLLKFRFYVLCKHAIPLIGQYTNYLKCVEIAGKVAHSSVKLLQW